VPGIDHGVDRQGRKAPERRVHRVRIGQRQIRSADASSEHQIARQRNAVSVEAHVARRVTGHVHHAELQRATGENAALSERKGRDRGLIPAHHPVHLRGARRELLVVRQIRWMEVNRNLVLPAHLIDCTDVIDVRVREPDRVERCAGRAHHLDDALAFVARIDEYRPAARLIRDKVAILLEEPDGPDVDLHAE
jgi:hypothetical protein